jgi:ribosomal protein L13E
MRVKREYGDRQMALKDLVAQKAKLTEQAVEDIVADYVRYDEEVREIIFMPNAASLSNKAKVLIFLVAQQGWQFIIDDEIDVGVSPSRLEDLLGIGGGTLRPIIKDLKDGNLIYSKSGQYFVRATSLEGIKAELENPRRSMHVAKRTKTKKKPQEKRVGRDDDVDEVKEARSNVKRATRSGLSVADTINDLIEGNFFESGRTLVELHSRLHERAIIIKQSSLPNYLLTAVRDGRLTRQKQEINGKEVWVYRTADH